MPELPEAETIVRGLAGPLSGRTVRGVRVLRPDLLAYDTTAGRQAFRDGLRGGRILGVVRRGKNIVLPLEARSGGGLLHLVVNLGMSGRLLHGAPGDGSGGSGHPGVRLLLDDGTRLTYDDVRRFGRLRLLDDGAYRAWSARLGPEPLGRGFTAARLHEGLRRSISPVRSWLLDQRRVAGVGNIYANEALHWARLHPRTRAGDLSVGEVRRLHRALRRVLREAIRARGTTLRDFRTAGGEEGGFGRRLRVYGRGGLPCPRCGTAVAREVFGSRSAFACPRCQPSPGKES